MSENMNGKTGHPVLGAVLGIVGIVIALLATLVFGAAAGGLALLLGITATALGFAARRGGRGIGAIIAGILAVVLAVTMTFATVNAFRDLKQRADARGEFPLVSKYFDNPYLGIFGVALRIQNNEGTLQNLIDEMNALR